MGNGRPRQIALEDDLRLLIHGLAFFLVHDVARAHYLLVKLLAAIACVVVAIAGCACQQNAQEVVRAGVVASPADERCVVLAFTQTFEVFAPLIRHDFGFHTDLGPVGLDHFSHQLGIGVVGALHGHGKQCQLKAVGQAGFGQQLFGFFDIVRCVFRGGVIAPQAWRHGVDGLLRFALIYRVNNGLAVDGHIQRLTHFAFLQLAFFRVVVQVAYVEAGGLQHFQRGVAAHGGQIAGFRIRHDVAFARFHFLEAHCRVGGNGEDQVIHFRETRFPILLVGAVADLRVFLVAVKYEGAGTNRLLVELGEFAFFVQFFCIFRRQDGERRHGDLDNQIGVRLLQRHLDRMVIHFLYLGDVFRQACINSVGELSRIGFTEGVFRIEHAIEREYHVVGIEITRWGKGFGGMELHALAQSKGIGQAVFGNIPFLGQGRLYVGCTIDKTDQRVVDGVAAGVERAAAGIHAGVKAFGASFGTVHQSLAACAGGGRRCRAGAAGCRSRGLFRFAAGAQTDGCQHGKCQRRFGKHVICHESLLRQKQRFSSSQTFELTTQGPKNLAGNYL